MSNGPSVLFADGRSHLEYSRLLQTALQEFSLTRNQFLVMASLYLKTDHRGTPSELALEVGRTRSNVTLICNQLVEFGWASRRHKTDNRRHVDVALTTSGVHTIREALASVKAAIANHVDSTSRRMEVAEHG